MLSTNTKAFSVPLGMSNEIWIEKYSRRKEDGTYQTWEERIHDVVEGNFSLDTRISRRGSHAGITGTIAKVERAKELTHFYARKGIISLSGRHLQHGDVKQKDKVGELFTNCATAMLSSIKFYLLLKGSGVGRSYDSDIHFVDWDYAPNARFVLSSQHPDYQPWIESLEEAQHKYDSEGEDVRWFKVEDSAEGWVKVVTILETATFHKNNQKQLFIFDFSEVRGLGVPIKGQQGRPSSGPVPLITALHKVMSIKGAGYKPWKQALFIDHYLSDCVRIGGVRRSARLAVKHWKDRDVIDFIDVKRGGWLHTANNSIAVDEEFWREAASPRPSHARRVFEAAVSAAYWDETGEPGFINIDRLTWNNKGLDKLKVEDYINPLYEKIFGGIHYRTREMIAYILEKAKSKKYPYICNPCVEIVLALWGAYCVVGDACISNADSEEEAIEAVSYMGEMLVRTNLMNFLYKSEVDRTNRIGISLIGIHEFAAKIFGYSFHDLIDEEKSKNFWNFIQRMGTAATEHVNQVCDELGIEHPHTYLTLKPAGTIAKVMNVTEAANLPSIPYYVRWVQFKSNHPLLQEYRDRGYPVRDISKSEVRTDDKGNTYTVNGYADTSIVGFPTKPPITELLGDRVVCATDISVEQHYLWLQLLEKYWLTDGENNQISYTLKYDPKKTSYEEFMQMVLKHQPNIRCCAVMPELDSSAYIYSPEERITAEKYDEYMSYINRADREAIDDAALDCAGGACGIDANRNASAADEALMAAE